MMKSKIEVLRKRGYIDDLDLTIYLEDSYEELKAQLKSDIVFERTIAARLISKYKTEDTLNDLIEALKVEKKLGICRHLMLPNPSDALVLQAIVESISDPIIKSSPLHVFKYSSNSNRSPLLNIFGVSKNRCSYSASMA